LGGGRKQTATSNAQTCFGADGKQTFALRMMGSWLIDGKRQNHLLVGGNAALQDHQR